MSDFSLAIVGKNDWISASDMATYKTLFENRRGEKASNKTQNACIELKRIESKSWWPFIQSNEMNEDNNAM